MLTGLASIGFATIFTGGISCFSLVVSTVLAILLLVPTLLLQTYRNPDIPLPFRMISVFFAVLIGIWLLDEYCEFFTEMVKTGIPKWFIGFLFMLSVLYPCIKGIEAVSRAAVVGAVFAVLALVLIFVLLPWKDIEWINSADRSFSLEQSIGNIMMYTPFLTSVYFFRNIKGDKVKSVMIPALVTALIFTAVMCLGKMLSVNEYEFIFYALAEISCHVMPMGLSGFFIAFSLICVYFNMVYFCHSAKSALKNNSKLLSAIYVGVVYGLSMLTIYNETASKILQNKYLFIGIFVFQAVFLPISVAVKERNNEKAE